MFLALVISLLAEATILYPLYLLTNRSLLSLPLPKPPFEIYNLPVWLLIVLALGSLTVNFALSRRKNRLFTVLWVNFLLIGSSLYLLLKTMLPTEVAPLTPTNGLTFFFFSKWGALNSLKLWLSTGAVLWIEGRAFLRTRRLTNSAQIVHRFELGLGILFSVFLISSLTATPIPGGTAWLVVSFGMSTFALALAQKSLSPQHPIWLGPGVLLLFLVPLTFLFSFVMPRLSGPVGEAFAASFPVFQFLRDLFLAPLIWLLRLGHVIPEQRINQDQTLTQRGAIAASTAEKSGLEQFLHILFWIMIVLLVLAVFLLLGYLLVRLLRYLWKTQTQATYGTSTSYNLHGLKHVWQRVRLWWVRFALSIRFLLPFSSKLGIAQAYQLLLSWGEKKRHPRLTFETPNEYCERLGQLFPEHAPNLKLITKTYVYYFFGARADHSFSKHRLYEAVRTLYK